MPKRRKNGNKFTTISILWEDKIELRKYAKFKKETKNGKLYETDSEVIHMLLDNTPPATQEGHPTYPTIHQDKPQQD